MPAGREGEERLPARTRLSTEGGALLDFVRPRCPSSVGQQRSTPAANPSPTTSATARRSSRNSKILVRPTTGSPWRPPKNQGIELPVLGWHEVPDDDSHRSSTQAMAHRAVVRRGHFDHVTAAQPVATICRERNGRHREHLAIEVELGRECCDRFTASDVFEQQPPTVVVQMTSNAKQCACVRHHEFAGLYSQSARSR